MAHLRILFTLTAGMLAGTESTRACGPFYVAPPPTIDYYLHQLPGKGLAEIAGKPTAKPLPINIDNAIDDLVKKFAGAIPAERIKAVDGWLNKARTSCSPVADLNLLETIRDAAGLDGIAPDELTHFVLWRRQHVDWFSDASSALSHINKADVLLDSSSPAMLPCWTYEVAAMNFCIGRDDMGESGFAQVVSRYGKSSFAETSLYMQARCWRNRINPYAPPNTFRETAQHLFHQYLNLYPKGRFAADAWGFLGGIESDQSVALADFARQAAFTDHPEVFATAESEVERIFSHLDYTAGDAGFDQIAHHPELALALTYAVLETNPIPMPEDDFHPSVPAEEQAQGLKWRASVLPKLAAAVLAHKDLYHGAIGEERYLTILAHAASDHGDQDKALDLISMPHPGHAPSDDFLFVKALVFQRSGRLTEAAKTYRALLAAFPDSALAPGVHYRLALALHDLKQDGPALLQLATLTNNRLPIFYPRDQMEVVIPSPSPYLYRAEANEDYYQIVDHPGAQASQIRQTMETLLNFAPVDSLAVLLQDTDPEHAIFRKQLREVVVSRYLAHDDFQTAARLSEDPALKKEFAARALESDLLLRTARTAQRNRASPARHPEAWAATAVALADYWSSHRSQLTTAPLHFENGEENYYGFGAGWAEFRSLQVTCPDLRRLQNGRLLNYPENDLYGELDSRDELTHALSWWQRAIEFDPAGSRTSQALWKTIQARRLIAEQNAYTLQRAAQMNVTAKVRRDYDHLITAFPDSIEARQYAVYWTIPQPGALEAAYSRYQLAEKYPGYDSQLTHFGHLYWFLALKIPFEDNDSVQSAPWKSICEQLDQLPESSKNDNQSVYAQKIGDLREKARPLAVTINRAAVINCLDDLVDLGTVPNLDPGIRTAYLRERIFFLSNSDSPYASRIQPLSGPADSAETGPPSPLADFEDCLLLSKNADDSQHLAGLAEAFLKKYPKSPKRELAAFYRIRGLVRLPNAKPDDPAYVQSLDAAFAGYEKEFPHGNLRNGVLWMHGQTEVTRQHESQAAHYFSLLLQQNESPELKQDSAYQLAVIFDQLNDDSLRHDLLHSFLHDPVIRPQLQAYTACGELPFLTDYVTDQLAKS